ncbi:hypothetical protein RU639_013100 [Aspergillus parasiticus]
MLLLEWITTGLAIFGTAVGSPPVADENGLTSFGPLIPLRYECPLGHQHSLSTGGCRQALQVRDAEARRSLEGMPRRRRCPRGYKYATMFKQCRQLAGMDDLDNGPPVRHLDPFTAPRHIILDAIKIFGDGVMDLINGRPCIGVSKLAIPGVHSVIKNIFTTPEGKSAIKQLEQEIADFLDTPGIHQTWEFLSKPLTDIPLIGPAISSVGSAEAWIFNNLVPSFARKKLQSCIDDGLRHPNDDPFFFILGAAVNLSQHPTILDLLLAIPGVAELTGALEAAEEAAKLAEAARDLGTIEEALGAEMAAERAIEFAKAARGTEYEDKAAKAARHAEESANNAQYHVEQHAKGSPPVEGESNVHNVATTLEVPYVPDEGIRIVEDAELRAANEAELDEALENTWSENGEASQVDCKRAPGLKCLQRKLRYKVFDDVPSVQDLVANIQEYGQVEKGNSLFYSSLDGHNGVTLSTEHYKKYILKTTGRQGFAIDRITDKMWSRAQMDKMKTPAMVDRFGRRLSQAFAETAQGDIYFFTRSGLDGTTFPATSVWGGWEYPALTRNPKVKKIIQVDPFKNGDLGHTIWTPDKGPSPNAPKSGNVA